jgi:pyruvate, water dikinase
MTGRGFVSVLFEATANPSLATPFRSPYAQRTYVMISSSFMNLQSRSGFHFSTVEALVGERDAENYLSFSFKGGAADLERRRARVGLLADVLERHGFVVEVIGDAVTARVVGMNADATQSRLRVVGYLVMHTRQLDTVMADPVAVQRYRDKLLADILRVV